MNETKRVFNRGRWLSSKICVVCARPFNWRKKWERNWEQVTTCSKKCNNERRRRNRRIGQKNSHIVDFVQTAALAKPVLQPAHCTRAQELNSSVSTSSSKENPKADIPSDGSSKQAPFGLLTHEHLKTGRKTAKKQANRAIRKGHASQTGQKTCNLCGRLVDLLIRCQHDSSRRWSMVCGRCWNLSIVAGGVVDGDGTNPHYRYGGVWRNRK